MAVTKTGGDGKTYPASAWLHKPDLSKPTTWKLRFKEYVNGQLKVTRRILGMAHAALTKGFRGSKVQLPGGAGAKYLAKVRSMMKSLGTNKEQIQMEMDLLKDCGIVPDVLEEVTEGMIYDTFEEVSLEPGSVEIDRENGVLKRLPILGLVSKNRRRYVREAVKDAAKRGVYEGLPCYKDHASGKPRRVDDLIGRWSETHFDDTTDMLRGNLKTLKIHREQVFDFVDNGPTLASPSHVVEGKTRKVKENGTVIEVVEYIGKGHSVDLVAGAATVNSLLESSETKLEAKAVTENKELEKYVDESTTDNTGLEEMLKGLQGDIKALREENADLKTRNEAAEKVAYQTSLRDALVGSKLPEKARAKVLEMYGDDVVDAGGISKIVKEWEDLAGALAPKAEDPVKPTVKVPTEENKKTDPDKVTTLKEAVHRKLNIKSKE